ncbi:translation initiation factor IF-3, mitochondrial-like [Acanthaster planci]|uniref:Translation initiation factor IF-3, mitochondrial-like n=1 Tax=Acanthaster planci TaxID=133434 RepID=A0A8B7YIW2_ACAPL|nr:translation initiation factor IF-3, mitochondrial-like [Acanthaster planci]XP_022091540.1 translation initiation factor IF-3, mitochondrial-like [Acanthaster planci]XP_022091541.1 translation initiation factor IF-3, mitochondrial-like [Acanthaster planci]
MSKLLMQRVVSSRARRLHYAVGEATQHHQPVCCCYESRHHRNRIIPHQPIWLGFARTTYSAGPIPHHRRWDSIFTKPTSMTKTAVFLRSLSSESGSDTPLDQIDSLEEDSFEEVAKELDAEGTGPRRSWKGKSSSDSLKDTMKSVGRLVPDKIVTLLDEAGVSLGPLHRKEAIKRSQEARLKLVLINPNSKPYPTYRLMTGQQLHQEQMSLREKLKAKSAPTQVKEVRLSGNIEKHDLEVKRRHMHDWFEEGGAQVHVKVTLMGARKRQKPVSKEQQLVIIGQLMSGLEDRVTFASKPREVGKDGMNLTVTLRPMSAKEKAALVKQKNKDESMKQPQGGTSDSGQGAGEGEATAGMDEKAQG